MRRRGKKRGPGTIPEDVELNEFMEGIAPREPRLKVYRLEPNGKQTLLYATVLEFFSLDELRDQFDGGTFLLRTIRSNGTYGPSRVVHIAPLRESLGIPHRA